MRDFRLPPGESIVNEMFSWLEFPRLMMNTQNLLNMPRGEGRTIVVLPGFGAGDLSTTTLRQYLRALDYDVRGWNQGSNTGDVLELLDSMKQLTQEIAHEKAAKIDLIGWSLGGYIAREVARDLPEHVNSVITLGSPVVGGPKYTRVAPVFKARGVDIDEIERLVDERYEVPLKVPVTAIYSKRDGVVSWEACFDHKSSDVEHIEVRASHLGLGFSPEVFQIIAEKLVSRRVQ